MLGSDTDVILGCGTLDVLGLSLKAQVDQIARARRVILVTGIMNHHFHSCSWVALSISAFEDGGGGGAGGLDEATE